MKRLTVSTLALAALMPFAAQAAPGYVTDASEMIAGPGDMYPSIGAVPSGAVLNVVGCLGNYRWCDVVYKNERGWITGDRLKVAVEGRYVALADYGLRSRIPVTTFEQATYWDSNYRSRPFYDEHHYWTNLNNERAKREEEQVRQEIVKQEVRDELRASESAETRASGGRR